MKVSLHICALLAAVTTLVGCSSPAGSANGNPASSDQHAPPTTERLEPYECGTIKRLHTFDGLFLASQPMPEDFEQAQQSGVKTVVNFRHEAEIVEFDEAAFVKGIGLNYINVPWGGPAELTDEIFSRSIEILNSAERPILLHCSSGNRVGAIWIPWRVLEGGLSYEAALAEAKTIGLKIPVLGEQAKAFIDKNLH